MDWPRTLSPQTPQMISVLFAAIFKVALPLLVIIALIDHLTMSQPRRVRRLARRGLSQRAIASRLSISRYRVRMALS
jgi:DNA-binding NarL/FixJ family response regulator